MTQNFKHKKSLGQNFLTNSSVIDHIVDASNISEDDVVIEIGPGQGILTEALAQKAQRVIAIELDDRLIPLLKKRFLHNDYVTIIHGDVLHMNIAQLIDEQKIGDCGYKVVANIPYYITAPIIRLFLELSVSPKEIVLMVQKEVGKRLTATPGAMSVLAVSAQYYAYVKYLFTVPRTDFDPVPAVDSAVIQLTMKNEKLKTSHDTKSFFRTVKIGFSAKRKTLVNNFANGYHKDKKDIEEILRVCNIDVRARAQELSLEQWHKLSAKFSA